MSDKLCKWSIGQYKKIGIYGIDMIIWTLSGVLLLCLTAVILLRIIF